MSEPYFYIMIDRKEIGAIYPMNKIGDNLYSSECAVILYPEEHGSLPAYFDIIEVDREDRLLIRKYNKGYVTSFESLITQDKMFGVTDFIILRGATIFFEGEVL